MEDDYEMQDNEEDADLQLTEDFKKKIKEGKCLFCTQVELLSLLKNDEQKGKKDYDNDIFKSTKEYLEEFNKYGIDQNPVEKAYKIRKIFDTNDEPKCTPLEEVLLIDLAPSSAEEAFALIPSLKKKFKAEELNEYLDKLNKKMFSG